MPPSLPKLLAFALLAAILAISPVSAEVEHSPEDIIEQFEAINSNNDLSIDSKLNAIRDLAYANIDGASVAGNLAGINLQDVSRENLIKVFTRFSADVEGVWCAKTADVLSLVYRHLGYEAWTLHYGFRGPNLVTHAVTLVRTGSRIVVQDAYFNITYVNDSGDPLDLFDIAERLRNKNPPQYSFGENMFKDMHRQNAGLISRLSATPLTSPSFPFYGRGKPMQVKVLDDQRIIIRAVFDPLAYQASINRPTHPDHETMTRLREAGYPAELIYLLLYPIGLSYEGKYTDLTGLPSLQHHIATKI